MSIFFSGGTSPFGENEMKITVSETGSGKLTALIITNPTDN